MPVGVAGAHLAEADGVGRGGEGRHERPRLVHRFLGGAGHRVEVVVDPHRLEPERLDPLGDVEHRWPLLIDRHTNEVVAPALWGESSESHGCDPTAIVG